MKNAGADYSSWSLLRKGRKEIDRGDSLLITEAILLRCEKCEKPSTIQNEGAM